MIDWAERANTHFLHAAAEGTPETPETYLLGVLGVHPPHIGEIAYPTDAELIAAAMKACDFHKDSDAGREEMRRQVLEVPHELRVDLLEYFSNSYGPKRFGTGERP
jgi:hypothetical protein